jgi:hypothetical protein
MLRGISLRNKNAGLALSLFLLGTSAPAAGQVLRLPGPPPEKASDPAAPPPGATPTASASTPLRLEWPSWLDLPGARLLARGTKARGRIVAGSAETCTGDVLGKPSQGCLEKVFESPGKVMEVYAYYEDLLERYGYTDKSPSSKPYASVALGKNPSDTFASLTMREYPTQDPDYYRQVTVFLRQLSNTSTTKAELSFLIKSGADEPAPESAGTQKKDFLSFPPDRSTWTWAIQSVALPPGSANRHSSFYYEAPTDRSVAAPLTLPAGAVIVGVFPDDCAFSVREARGSAPLNFPNESQAKGKTLAAGTWSVYPQKCGGVAVFLK